MEDLVFCCISFSCYLTLYDWSISFYLILLVFAACKEVFSLFKYDVSAVLPLLLNTLFYWTAVWFLGIAYYEYEVHAGGNRPIVEEVAMDYNTENYLNEAALENLMKKDKKEKKKKKRTK
eukprot:CAMPEP_0170558324 /NCGR_PEP_ID=MMETSP0211-20121228/34474_1 /TAXON_ID=311385 /ORGANISM="Pseudokeronopsis sp., Strain OXSARD2" /LENGTH=119 /DNA_ID=CAMNT_0010870151 /DNA_START=119 /DNA_END=478 /DNA_ORIENTATION=+